jgi:hypothetical protein
LPGWATPDGWRKGLRPHNDSNPTSDHHKVSSAPAHDNRRNGAATAKESSLVRQIEALAEPLGKALYRGLLKSVARAWDPNQIHDTALQQRVLEHMQAAERGLQRLKSALERVGTEPLPRILNSQRVVSLEKVDSLETLKQIVLALEALPPRSWSQLRRYRHPESSFFLVVQASPANTSFLFPTIQEVLVNACISAIQHVRRLRGGSQSQLLRASDGLYYVTKFQNNPQHVRVLANEMLATRLGALLGLPVPSVASIEVCDWLIEHTDDLRMDIAGLRTAFKAGLHLGSAYAADPIEGQLFDYLPEGLLQQVTNLEDFAR